MAPSNFETEGGKQHDSFTRPPHVGKSPWESKVRSFGLEFHFLELCSESRSSCLRSRLFTRSGRYLQPPRSHPDSVLRLLPDMTSANFLVSWTPRPPPLHISLVCVRRLNSRFMQPPSLRLIFPKYTPRPLRSADVAYKRRLRHPNDANKARAIARQIVESIRATEKRQGYVLRLLRLAVHAYSTLGVDVGAGSMAILHKCVF